MSATVLSVNVGLPRDVPWQDKTVHTGIWKRPVPGPVMVRKLNIDGDGQGDTVGHGGEQRAVLVYQIQSYRYWEQHFSRGELDYGSFGENLTVDGLPDDEVCIGDRYRIGEAEFEVTQPRVTCYRVGLRLGEPELPALLVSHHRPGFYLRVLREGLIQAGDPIVRTGTAPERLTVADTDALLYLPGRDRAKLRLATRIGAMSPGWRQSFQDLLDPDAGEKIPGWAGFRPLKVQRVVRENSSVSSLYFGATSDEQLPPFRAGQYLTVRVDGTGTSAAVRSYSLSSTSPGAGYRISVKHEPDGAVSTYLTTRVRAGAILDVAAPRGDFVLDDDTAPVLLVSAGIGLTPVLAMLHELAAARSDRQVWWLHGARGPAEHPLAEEVHRLIASLPDGHEHVFYSGAAAAKRGRVRAGRLTKDKLVALDLPADATAYVCGPASFTADMTDALAAAGIDPLRIHTELFGARPITHSGLVGETTQAPHPPPGPRGTGPVVTFARSGLSVAFPTGRTHDVLELAEACAVPARWSCRTGVCHTCVTPLLSGSVTYSPAPLAAPADGEALICCAQPATDVVLDL